MFSGQLSVQRETITSMTLRVPFNIRASINERYQVRLIVIHQLTLASENRADVKIVCYFDINWFPVKNIN